MVNRTQTLVLSFLLVAWLGLGAILVVAPEIYDQSLRLSPGDHRPVEGVFLVAITAFLTLLGIGVLRLWRWTFWLFLVAFLAGVLRVPASILQWLGRCGTCSSKHSSWRGSYLRVVQFVIGLTMLVGYRRSGVWAAF